MDTADVLVWWGCVLIGMGMVASWDALLRWFVAPAASPRPASPSFSPARYSAGRTLPRPPG